MSKQVVSVGTISAPLGGVEPVYEFIKGQGWVQRLGRTISYLEFKQLKHIERAKLTCIYCYSGPGSHGVNGETNPIRCGYPHNTEGRFV